MKTTLFQRSALVALCLLPISSWAATQLWSSAVNSPVPYNAEEVPAPVEVAPFGMGIGPLVRNQMLVVKPTGESISLYNTLIHRADGEDVVAFGLQLRSAQGQVKAQHVEPYTNEIIHPSTDPVLLGYYAHYAALSPNGGIWVAAFDNDGAKNACKILKFKPDLTKVSESMCPPDAENQTINQIVPLANNLAIVQLNGTTRNFLVDHRGVQKEFAQPIGEVMSSLRLGNGTTVLITADNYEEWANSTAHVQVLNSNGVVLSSTPLLTTTGEPISSYEFEVRQLNATDLLIVSRPGAFNASQFGGTGETIFTAFDIQQRITKWSRSIGSTVDYDISMGKVAAVGIDWATENPALFEISADGTLSSAVISDAPFVLKRYAYLLPQMYLFSLQPYNLFSRLTANLNGTLTINFTDNQFDENGDPALATPVATALTINAKTGAVLKSDSAPGALFGVQRDAFKRIYTLRTRPLLTTSPELFFNVSDPGQTFVEKFDAR